MKSSFKISVIKIYFVFWAEGHGYMNFLSHYYFDRNVTNCYHILGTVMPDLLKNADKTILIRPEKITYEDADMKCMAEGWNKHLEVDRHFHSSGFFITHSHQLKKVLGPVVEGSQAKPFFLGHIALELLLDNLLLTTGNVNVNGFYDHLHGCDIEVVKAFLNMAGLKDTDRFFRFFGGFKKDGYLHTYAETHHIAYALKRICMRVWKEPFTPEQEANMNLVLTAYRENNLNDFMAIFDEIENKLTVV